MLADFRALDAHEAGDGGLAMIMIIYKNLIFLKHLLHFLNYRATSHDRKLNQDDQPSHVPIVLNKTRNHISQLWDGEDIILSNSFPYHVM